jgi:hypothetical protein
MRGISQFKLNILALIGVALLLLLLFAGCVSREIQEPRFNIPTKKVETKDLSLNDVLLETSSVLTTSWKPYSLDDVLVYLNTKRPTLEPEEEEKTGPVKVRIIYPVRYSIIDRQVNFVASVYTETGKVDSVTFYLDGEEVVKLSAPPYQFTFNPETYSKSEHTIKVVAINGPYKDEDSLKFYNVVKGSIVIYPWRPSGGNIPYSYVNNYYIPEVGSVEVAMFTSYTSETTFFADFKRRINTDLNILLAKVNLEAVNVAYQGGSPILFQFYNYGLKKFDRNPIYIIGPGDESEPFEEKEYEAYSFYPYINTKEWDNEEFKSELIPFYSVNPFTKELWLRFTGTGPTKFFVRPITVEFYGIEDKTPPRPKYRNVFVERNAVTCEFYASEPVFATIYAYDADGKVRNYTEPKPEGWVEIKIADRNTIYVSLKVTDGAGHTVSLPKKRVRR